jgi:hypothetical protein
MFDYMFILHPLKLSLNLKLKTNWTRDENISVNFTVDSEKSRSKCTQEYELD